MLRQKGRTKSSTKLDVKNEPIFPGNGFDFNVSVAPEATMNRRRRRRGGGRNRKLDFTSSKPVNVLLSTFRSS